VRRRPNLLLLDEPTNHLDLEMRHALTAALAEFEGSMVLVPHDRALLRTVCDTLYLVADGGAREFDGDLDDYLVWLAARRESSPAADGNGSGNSDKAARKDASVAAAQERQEKLARRRPLLRELDQLDRQLASLHRERQTLDATLADPALYAARDPPTIRTLTSRQQEVARAIEEAEHRWLEAHGELEQIGEI
jgi:ATP-binding cassette subfamily F protein 3